MTDVTEAKPNADDSIKALRNLIPRPLPTVRSGHNDTLYHVDCNFVSTGSERCLPVLRFCIMAAAGDVEVIRAEGAAYGPEQDKAAMTSAQDRIGALVAA